MSAWSHIQQEWASNSDKKEKTGILLWDLSAAFDCLDTALLCEKLNLYGFGETEVNWFRSFLTGRSQRVKIGNSVSSRINLVSGVPQGGVLSPVLFVLYVADLEAWLLHSSAFTYADDTSTSVSDKDLEIVKAKMEEDAVQL